VRGEVAAAAFPIEFIGVAKTPDVAAKPKLAAASTAITNDRIEILPNNWLCRHAERDAQLCSFQMNATKTKSGE
jgi:hypothetical protein